LIAAGHKIICLRTFSKIYGLASLRVGYGYAAPEMISIVQRARQPFNVNAIGAAAAVAALDDHDFVAKCIRENRAGMDLFESSLTKIGVEFVPGTGNFILIKVGDGLRVFNELQTRGIITRPVNPYGLPEWLRITIGTRPQNERTLAALMEIVGSKG
jgi:histidinol-phosphate aminotransferase